MTLAAPLFLYALALLVPVLIAFLVRRRRRIVPIASTMLWRAAATRRAKSRRIQRLTRLLALLACLGGVAALGVAAARPSQRSRGETVAIVVDVSASMSAGGEAGPIAEARRALARMLAARGPGDRYAIIAAGPAPRRLAGPTDASLVLDEAASGIAVERGAADVGAALDLASSLVAGSPGARIVLLSDGGKEIGARGDLRGVPLTEESFRAPSRDNLGVVEMSARTPIDAEASGEREAMFTIATSSDAPRVARVLLLADGEKVAERRVSIPAGGEIEGKLVVRASSGELKVRVEPADGKADAVPIDDEATVAGGTRPIERALLVAAPGDDGARSFFTEKALLAAGIGAIERTSPEAAASALRPRDLLVVLGHAPPRRLEAPTLYLGATSGALPVGERRTLSTAADTRLRSVDGTDPLLRGVLLDGVTIQKATAALVPSDARTLVELDGGPVVMAGGAGKASWVFVGIDPEDSDLALRVAFPVLVANALGGLAGATDVVVADTVPRTEVLLREASSATEPAAASAPSWRLPFSPAALLALIAAALLSLELAMYRKGWAS